MPPDKVSTRAPASLVAADADMVIGSRSSADGAPRRDGEIERLLRVAEEFRADPTRLCAELAALLGDPGRLEVVAARSSIHPNGFAKVVLYPGDRFGIRLHIWSQQDDLWGKDAQPHGHRWAFASWIIVGAVREVGFFAEWRPGPSSNYDCYDYVREESQPRLIPIGNVVLYRGPAIDRVASTVYARARDTLHTAAPVGDGLTVSLVLQGFHHAVPTPVYALSGRRPRQGETALSADRVRSLIVVVLAALSNAGAHFGATQ